MTQGQKRSPGVVILLFIVTIGVYWFYWLYKAFKEVADREGRPPPPTFMVPILALVWVVQLAVSAFRVLNDVLARLGESQSQSNPPTQNPFSVQFEQFTDPVGLAIIGLGLVFYILQYFYLRPAHALIEETARRRGDPNPPTSVLVLLFSLFFAFGFVPLGGALLSIGAIVCAIVWVIQVQGAMNRYWDSFLMVAPMQPPGWMPQQPAPPPGYGFPPPPR